MVRNTTKHTHRSILMFFVPGLGKQIHRHGKGMRHMDVSELDLMIYKLRVGNHSKHQIHGILPRATVFLQKSLPLQISKLAQLGQSRLHLNLQG